MSDFFQIKFWKAEDPNNTLREVQIDRLPRPCRFKETAEVTNLYPNSHIQAEVVAVNTFFESTPSVVVSLITPEEGTNNGLSNDRVSPSRNSIITQHRYTLFRRQIDVITTLCVYW